MDSPDFATLVDQAWSDHARSPQAVADRLEAARPKLQSADDLRNWLAVWVHVTADHLGQWPRSLRELQALRGHGAADAGVDALLGRYEAALTLCSGDAAALDGLPPADRCAALATAAPMLAGQQRFDEAVATYDQALQLAAPGWADDAPAVRALAVGGNNLAEYLEEHTQRTPAQTRGMLRAAESALVNWQRCGNWMNDERAAFRLARSLMLAGQPEAAVRHAERCLKVCLEHDAPFEAFFAHSVLAQARHAAGDHAGAHAARAAAETVHAGLGADERPWCEAELRLLAALGSA